MRTVVTRCAYAARTTLCAVRTSTACARAVGHPGPALRPICDRASRQMLSSHVNVPAELDFPPVVKDHERAEARWLPIATWPGLAQLSRDPPVFMVPNFLTPEECTSLAAAGLPGLHRSIVVDGVAGKAPAPSRTSESCYLSKESTTWLAARVEALTGKPASTHEPPQVRHGRRVMCGSTLSGHVGLGWQRIIYPRWKRALDGARLCTAAGAALMAAVPSVGLLLFLPRTATGTTVSAGASLPATNLRCRWRATRPTSTTSRTLTRLT
jgi:hypothetical protein